MNRISGRRIASKTTKQRVLEQHPIIGEHIPPTSFFTREALEQMLNTHDMVYVKPNIGSGGFNIFRVEKLVDSYRFQIGRTIVNTKTFSELYNKLKLKMKRKTYIIQKGIDMLTINGLPVDYRVKYVKSGHLWQYRAVVGRIARSGLIVTNLHQGGKLVKGMTALTATVGEDAAEKKRELKRLTELSTNVLLNHFPGLSALGFDYGIDKNGKVWMFEVNTNPN